MLSSPELTEQDTMSQSETVQFPTSSSKNTNKSGRKKKLTRPVKSLKIIETEQELNYRKNYEDLNVVLDFPEYIKCCRCKHNFKDSILKGKPIHSHPLLDILMCKSCLMFYGNGEFSMDEDNVDKYCRWCGEGGNLFICSKCVCGFCRRCIMKNFGMEKVKEIDNDDDWICYFCDPKPLWKLRTVCHLAKLQSTCNKKGMSSKKGETKTATENQKESEDFNEVDKSSQKTDAKPNYGSTSLKRKRTYSQNSDTDVVSKTEDNVKLSAKRRLSKLMAKKHTSGKNFSNINTSSSSDSDDTDYNAYEDNWNQSSEGSEIGKSAHAVIKEKKLNKLKDILKVAETTSELYWKICKKKSIKFNGKNFELPDKKVIAECEKLKSMTVLISCSLSTIHNLIISLEQKCGVKENLGSAFHGKDHSSLLRAIGRILRDKRVKTSYLVHVVKDLLNKYPFIEIESKFFNNSLMNAVNREEKASCIYNNARPGASVNPGCSSLKQTAGEHNEKDKCPEITTDVSNGHEKLDVDKRIRTDYLMLKENLLKSSSDDSDSDDDKSISGAVEMTRPNKSGNRNNNKSRVTDDSKEKRSIANLMNLSSLEGNVQSEIANRESNSISRRRCVSENETESDHDIDRSFSEEENSPNGFYHVESNRADIDFLKESAEMLKNHILDSSNSSSEDESESEDSAAEPGLRRRRRRRSSSASTVSLAGRVSNRRRKDSSWKCDSLLWDQPSDPSSDELESRMRESEKKMGERRKFYMDSESDESPSDSTASTKILKKARCRRISTTSDSLSSDYSGDVEYLSTEKPDTPTSGRKNIKKILKTGNLQVETKQAIRMENERKKRVAERNEIYEELFPNIETSDRLVLDFDRDTKEVLLEVPYQLAKKLKPHQKKGIKFMWDSCFESLENVEDSNGSGCILAHCMGLGKTLQIITLIVTVMSRSVGVKTVLIACPLNVISNWVYEFELWLKDSEFQIDVYHVNNFKKDYQRYWYIRKWHNDGGVLILGYDLLRNLTNTNKKRKNSKINFTRYSEFLLDPGADMVVCDEGHLLKNQGTALSQTMMKIKTSRRIILTGTPLQNNLLEYHSMIQFIKPNILGTKKEFMNRFGNPIKNGQFEDSTVNDVKLMKARSHVLHSLLDGCIQRFGFPVLTPYLPEKHEYVISVRLTETQAKLYRYFLEKYKPAMDRNRPATLFRHFHLLQRIWTHPRVVVNYLNENEDAINDDETDEDSSDSVDSVVCLDIIDPGKSNCSDKTIPNWREMINENEYDEIRSSGKLILLFHILRRSKAIGDKVLVFSNSLNNLNLIEYFLKQANSRKSASSSSSSSSSSNALETWEEGLDYYRIEGSTSYETRTKWCKSFNNKNNKRTTLFLISTKAGGLGINLVAANRVIIFDVSWNPSQDVQSIFRVYRFGQKKTCFIYRFVAEGTMEEKIYARQVTKLSLEKRVLDEHQIERHYTMGNLQELYRYDPQSKDKWTVPIIPKDVVLAEIINNKDLIACYHEHDSLLENKQEDELTEEERKAAWEDFEKERFMAECLLRKTPLSINGNFNLPNENEQPAETGGAEMFNSPNVQGFNNVFLKSYLSKIYDDKSLLGNASAGGTPLNSSYGPGINFQHFQNLQ